MNKLYIIPIILFFFNCKEAKKEQQNSSDIATMSNIVSFWDFGTETPFTASGKWKYTLKKGNDLVIVDEIKGVKCIDIKEGGYLFIPRKDCPALDFHGKNSKFTIIAKVNRKEKSYEQCEAIAGMWNETQKKRQYYLFLNLLQKESGDQVCGHVSDVGGPTPGHKWARDASIGKTPVEYGQWVTVAFTFDGQLAKSYLNGKLDSREGLNPYEFNHELFDGGNEGADFTVGAVDRLGEIGNFFVGGIAQLAVFNRALSEKEIETLTVNLNTESK